MVARGVAGVDGVGSASDPLFLGLDLGTSSLKALLADGGGRVAARASRAYPLRRPHPGWAEQSPRDWWSAVVAALAGLAARGAPLSRVAAIGLSGQMHGLVLLDADHRPLAPCQTWADARCAAEAAEIARVVPPERLRALAGSPASVSATAAKLLWTRRHQPDVFAAARAALLPKDYLRLRLTGILATDPSDASGTLLCDVAHRDWSPSLLNALALPHDLLPPIVESPAITGTLLPEAASALGLPPGIPVVAGGGDAECAAIGLGLVGGTGDAGDAGVALVTLGTAGQFFAVTPAPLFDESGRLQTLCHAVPDHWHIMHAILTGASALDWLAHLLAAPGQPPPTVASLLDEAEAEPPGAHGLLFLPHLNGVRLPHPDPSAAGAFVGLRPGHGRAALARAVVEGVAFSLRDGLDAARDLGIRVERIRLAGGARRHPVWPRVLAGIFGLPVELGATEDASALGAALLAAAGSGALPSVQDAAVRLPAPTVTVTPDPAALARYAALAPLYHDADTRLRAVFHGLASAEQQPASKPVP